MVGLYNVGAGTDGIAAALEAGRPRRDVVFIAHELTDVSRRALIDGTIDMSSTRTPATRSAAPSAC